MTEGAHHSESVVDSRMPVGYASLIDRFREYEKPRIVNRLASLYPEMAGLLHNDGQQNDAFKMRINNKYGVVMDEGTRGDILEGLNSGNPKVIAVLAYYVWEKSRGNLPLETMQKNPLQDPSRLRQLRKTCGERALQLMSDMQELIGQEEQKSFVAEKVRTDWEAILSNKPTVGAIVKEAETLLSQEREAPPTA